jgi:hypothetical protein
MKVGQWVALLCLGFLLPAMSLRSMDESQGRFLRVLYLLDSYATGRQLIDKAKRAWKVQSLVEFTRYLRWGSASRTDSTLVRNYNPRTGEEQRERRVEIVLREDQRDSELILDLAHELTHALARPAFDPYDPHLTLGSYLTLSIEGEGGEVAAMISECSLSLEMFEKQVDSRFRRCKKYLDHNQVQFSRARLVRDFYLSGQWYGVEVTQFPYLSELEPQFYSSIVGLPYPHALIQEYKELTQSACRNALERKEKSAQSGSMLSPLQAEFLKARCQEFRSE